MPNITTIHAITYANTVEPRCKEPLYSERFSSARPKLQQNVTMKQKLDITHFDLTKSSLQRTNPRNANIKYTENIPR